MPVTDAQKRATMKYMKNNYDRIELKVPKGKKADIQAHAQTQNESLNGFVNRAIDETVERDTSTTPIGEHDKPQNPKSSKEFEVAQINLTDEEVAHIKKRRLILNGTDGT